MATVGAEQQGEIAVLVIDNPSVNDLGAAVGRQLADALAAALASDEVAALLIRGAGRMFSAAASSYPPASSSATRSPDCAQADRDARGGGIPAEAQAQHAERRKPLSMRAARGKPGRRRRMTVTTGDEGERSSKYEA